MFGTLSAISFALTGITRSMMENVSPWFAAAALEPCVKQWMAQLPKNPIQSLGCSLDRLGFLPTSSSLGLLCSRWDRRSISGGGAGGTFSCTSEAFELNAMLGKCSCRFYLQTVCVCVQGVVVRASGFFSRRQSIPIFLLTAFLLASTFQILILLRFTSTHQLQTNTTHTHII